MRDPRCGQNFSKNQRNATELQKEKIKNTFSQAKQENYFMLYSINKNDKVDTIFTTHLNTILDLLQQVEDYTQCDDKTIFIKYGITKKDVAALVTNIKTELNILYERYTNLGYTYNTAIAQQFKMCYEKLYLVA